MFIRQKIVSNKLDKVNSINLIIKYSFDRPHTKIPTFKISPASNPITMPSKHTHCYSNYVNHILNTSPTKVTYTFPKEQRFSPSLIQHKAPIDQILEKAFPSSRKKVSHDILKQTSTSKKKLVNNFIEKDKQAFLRYPATAGQPNRKDQMDRSRSIGQNNQIYPFQKYLNNQILRGVDQGKKFERSKSSKAVRFEKDLRAPSPLDRNKSPGKKKKIWGKEESPQKQQRKRLITQVQPSKILKKDTGRSFEFPQNNSLTNNKYLKYSPYYRQYAGNNGQQNSQSKQKKVKWKGELSRSKQQQKHSRIKTSTTVLQQMDHPSKHITVQGYYPLGMQINPNGKYVPSTYKNVPAHSFGKRPAKNQKNLSQTVKRFSITPDKNKILLPNGAQLYPEGSYNYKQLTEKKSNKQGRKSQERFLPFSQFGHVTAYRY